MAESIHIGRKTGRIRDLKGIKQEVLAAELGITQAAVSILERSETIFKLIDKMLTNKKFKDFFQKNVATL
ncbi:MAG: transcriptional regulator [Mucilaginibacter sp.]|nr:transcriptional regulator [Mucilaginibacter sp.]